MTVQTYCVYEHKSPSGKSYIGQTINYKKRCGEHRRDTGFAFASAVRKYGWDAFTHTVILDGLTLDDANELEEFLIAELDTMVPNGYNLRTGGENSRPSKETRAKMSASSKGHAVSSEQKEKARQSSMGNKNATGFTHSQDARNNMSAAQKSSVLCKNSIANMQAGNLGRKHTVETKAKMRIASTGRTHSKETRAKLSAINTGRVMSKETHCKLVASLIGNTRALGSIPSAEKRAKISRSLKGRVVCAETREKISAAQKGRVYSPEARANMSVAQKGRTKSPEHRANHSISMIAYWAKRKAL